VKEMMQRDFHVIRGEMRRMPRTIVPEILLVEEEAPVEVEVEQVPAVLVGTMLYMAHVEQDAVVLVVGASLQQQALICEVLIGHVQTLIFFEKGDRKMITYCKGTTIMVETSAAKNNAMRITAFIASYYEPALEEIEPHVFYYVISTGQYYCQDGQQQDIMIDQKWYATNQPEKARCSRLGNCAACVVIDTRWPPHLTLATERVHEWWQRCHDKPCLNLQKDFVRAYLNFDDWTVRARQPADLDEGWTWYAGDLGLHGIRVCVERNRLLTWSLREQGYYTYMLAVRRRDICWVRWTGDRRRTMYGIAEVMVPETWHIYLGEDYYYNGHGEANFYRQIELLFDVVPDYRYACSSKKL